VYSELAKESLVTCHVVEDGGVGLEEMQRLCSEWHILDIDMATSDQVKHVDGDAIPISEELSINWVLLTEELVMEEIELFLRDILLLLVS
jgi:hypothetical protein